jgi:hypothetical protein
MRNILIITVAMILAVPLAVWPQNGNKLVRQGNSYYEDGKYKDAEIRYLKSLEAKGDPHRGLYNLGDAFYMQNNYLDATAAFDSVRTMKMDDATRSQAYYNLGNSLVKLAKDSAQLAGEALQNSVESYKQSLRLNPGDMDAKYNLAYAQRLLQQQQQQQQDKQDQNKDQNKDQQNKDQQKQDQQNKQDDQKQQQQQKQQQEKDQQAQEQQQEQQQSGEPQQISKEDADRMLEALKNDEKQTLEKLKKARVKAIRQVKTEKDW